MNSLLKIAIINFIVIFFSALILTACSSSKLIQDNEKKCPYLEGKDE